MEQSVLDSIVNETRREQGIPPFFDDSDIANLIKEGVFRLNRLVAVDIDYELDLKAKSLLKNYVFYAFHQRIDDFLSNYQGDILSLQFDYIPVCDE